MMANDDKRTSGVLRFRELLPERDHFELEDGSKIEFRSRREFDAVDVAKLQEFDDRRDAADKALRESGYRDEQAAQQIDDVVDELVLFILPKLPEEVLNKLSTGAKAELIEWWNRRNVVKVDAGEVPEDQQVET